MTDDLTDELSRANYMAVQRALLEFRKHACLQRDAEISVGEIQHSYMGGSTIRVAIHAPGQEPKSFPLSRDDLKLILQADPFEFSERRRALQAAFENISSAVAQPDQARETSFSRNKLLTHTVKAARWLLSIPPPK